MDGIFHLSGISGNPAYFNLSQGQTKNKCGIILHTTSSELVPKIIESPSFQG